MNPTSGYKWIPATNQERNKVGWASPSWQFVSVEHLGFCFFTHKVKAASTALLIFQGCYEDVHEVKGMKEFLFFKFCHPS